MGIEAISKDVLVVTLSELPHSSDEFVAINEAVAEKGGCDLVVDFSSVNIMTSSSISDLLKLRQLLCDYGHRLILCNVSAFIKSIFTVSGLDAIFDFADDKSAALAAIQPAD